MIPAPYFDLFPGVLYNYKNLPHRNPFGEAGFLLLF